MTALAIASFFAFLYFPVRAHSLPCDDGTSADCNAEDVITLLQSRTSVLIDDAIKAIGAPKLLPENKRVPGVSKTAPLLDLVENMAVDAAPRDKTLVKEISRILETTLLPDLLAERKSAQEELESLRQNIQTCNDNLKSGVEDAEVFKQAVDTSKSTHVDCRTREKTIRATKETKCKALTSFLDNLPTQPSAGATVPEQLDFMEKSCSNKDVLKTMDQECTSAKDTEEAEHKQCDLDQAKFEGHICEYRTKLHTVDEAGKVCYSSSKTAFDEQLLAKKKLEEDWIAEYQGMKKIQCYLKVWLSDDDVNTVDKAVPRNCNDIKVDTLDLQKVKLKEPADGWIPVEDSVDMSSVEHYPGSDGFVSTYYTDDTLTYNAVAECVALNAGIYTSSGKSLNLHTESGSDGDWVLVHISSSESSDKHNLYPVDGEHYSLLASNSGFWASLSETDMHDLWFNGENTVMKLHSYFDQSGPGGYSNGLPETWYIQRATNDDFSPFHAIRYIPEWGGAGSDYKISAASGYDADSNTVTHMGRHMNHWESHNIQVNGKTYTTSRHGMPGDLTRGCQWLYWFTQSSCPNSAAYCNGACHPHGNGRVITKIYLGSKSGFQRSLQLQEVEE